MPTTSNNNKPSSVLKVSDGVVNGIGHSNVNPMYGRVNRIVYSEIGVGQCVVPYIPIYAIKPPHVKEKTVKDKLPLEGWTERAVVEFDKDYVFIDSVQEHISLRDSRDFKFLTIPVEVLMARLRRSLRGVEDVRIHPTGNYYRIYTPNITIKISRYLPNDFSRFIISIDGSVIKMAKAYLKTCSFTKTKRKPLPNVLDYDQFVNFLKSPEEINVVLSDTNDGYLETLLNVKNLIYKSIISILNETIKSINSGLLEVLSSDDDYINMLNKAYRYFMDKTMLRFTPSQVKLYMSKMRIKKTEVDEDNDKKKSEYEHDVNYYMDKDIIIDELDNMDAFGSNWMDVYYPVDLTKKIKKIIYFDNTLPDLDKVNRHAGEFEWLFYPHRIDIFQDYIVKSRDRTNLFNKIEQHIVLFDDIEEIVRYLHGFRIKFKNNTVLRIYDKYQEVLKHKNEETARQYSGFMRVEYSINPKKNTEMDKFLKELGIGSNYMPLKNLNDLINEANRHLKIKVERINRGLLEEAETDIIIKDWKLNGLKKPRPMHEIFTDIEIYKTIPNFIKNILRKHGMIEKRDGRFRVIKSFIKHYYLRKMEIEQEKKKAMKRNEFSPYLEADNVVLRQDVEVESQLTSRNADKTPIFLKSDDNFLDDSLIDI